MKKEDRELVIQYVFDKIEELYGEDVLKQFKSIVDDREKTMEHVESLKVIAEDNMLNFGLDYHIDELHARLYLYPDGEDNQSEFIMLYYNEHAQMIYVSGHGEKTSVNYVCKPTQDEIISCLMTTISKFRTDNGWTWEMPCEIRFKEQNN